MKKIFIGTAGWSYKDWVGHFYLKSQSADYDWLKYYARFFNSVEVNSTYYGYPKTETIKSWLEKVSHKDNFIFEIKLHQDFTHLRKFDNGNVATVKQFIDILKNSGRFGSLLIQFPYSFHMNDVSATYVSKLAETFAGYKKVIEVRHNSWNNDSAIKLFHEHELTFCSIDQPEIGKSLKFNITISDRRAYLRLHGRNKDEWFTNINDLNRKQSFDEKNARYDYKYSLGELTEIKMMIEEHFSELDEIHIIFNNHPKGKAPINALELNAVLDKQVPKILEERITEYPELKKVVMN